jgi:hypothetical protein
MTVQHRELAAGRWFQLSLIEQLANTGSEVERALNWQQRGSSEHSMRAVERALELLDLTIADARNRGRLRELTRVREVLVDYFYADNRFGSSPARWHTYFNAFAVAARAGR